MYRLVVYVGTGIVLYWGLKWLLGKKDGTVKDRPNKYFMWAAISASVLFWVYGSFFGPKRPGAFFERSEYSAKVYVLLYPDDQNVKSYRVPALIWAEGEGDSYDQNDDYCPGYRVYRIVYAYMPNGGSIDFGGHECKLNETVTAFDSQGRYWGIRLTNELVGGRQKPGGHP